ncbi:MAG: TVP38/TMEM64 family protein [Pegethrix bostrychoides GSE-TBD4-15B]|jgi:uncharacterized membrane protein YdjX (TVP38/TMEM64 family)|uniref:TVP38/TMEM64 family membrane protein n=1 Tax=Pegethrix bostrychoides GSE-TBD4-15B TaxID=2839662 RepID=A0A951U727_9CYAN|nr:TVP38/TMEM64 family protein [Pegethrix bostrychoides GSE-TBD4-15B]
MQSKTSGSLINLTQLILAASALTAGLTFALPALADSAPAADSAWHLQTALQTLLAQVQGWGAAGVAAFVALYVLATLLFVPGLLLTLGAGFIYGVAQGTLYVMLGASLGAILAFLTGRYLVRNWVSRQLQSYPKFTAIDRAVEREGFKIVLLARLSPLFPFNLLNYAFGITSVSLRDYALGCWGMLPGTLLYVYLGSLAGSLATLNVTSIPNPALRWGIQGLGLAATLATTLYGAKIAQQALAATADSQAGES